LTSNIGFQRYFCHFDIKTTALVPAASAAGVKASTAGVPILTARAPEVAAGVKASTASAPEVAAGAPVDGYTTIVVCFEKKRAYF